jgi:hypothetical protein
MDHLHECQQNMSMFALISRDGDALLLPHVAEGVESVRPIALVGIVEIAACSSLPDPAPLACYLFMLTIIESPLEEEFTAPLICGNLL